MTGWEQFVAWLFGIVMAAATVMAAVKAIADARVACAQVQFGALHVPADWTKGSER